MSVLIKGMEMPKRCGGCPCFHAENPMYCQAVKADKNKKIIAPYGKPRPDWCPLVPVPDHGRLIDADALIEKCEEMADDGDGNQLDALVFLRWFFEQKAPTIIPADKEGEG